MAVHRLSRVEARRIAIGAQMLDGDRPRTLLEVVERVTFLQIDPPVVPVAEARRIRDERRLRALGIARANALAMPMEPVHVGDAGEPAVVEGVPGEWRVDREALERPVTGRTALLSPFDRLVHAHRVGRTERHRV